MIVSNSHDMIYDDTIRICTTTGTAEIGHLARHYEPTLETKSLQAFEISSL